MFDALFHESTMADVDLENALPLDETLFEASVALEAVYADFGELDRISNTLDDLEQLGSVIRNHGVTQSLLAFTGRERLLSSVMPGFGACESLGTDAVVGSVEAAAALEAVDETVQKNTGSWFKSAWDAVVRVGEKIGEFAKRAFDKVVAAAKWTAGKVWDAAKAVKDAVVAHPIATVLAVLALAASAGTIVAAVTAVEVPAAPAGLAAFKAAVLGKFNSVGKGIVGVGEKGLFWKKKPIVEKATGGVLGYTKEAFDNVVASAKSVFADDGALKKSVNTYGLYVRKQAEVVKGFATDEKSAHRQALNWLNGILKSLWSFISGNAAGIVTSALSTFHKFFRSAQERKDIREHQYA